MVDVCMQAHAVSRLLAGMHTLSSSASHSSCCPALWSNELSFALACTTAGMLIGIAGNVMKQNAIFPPPEDPEMAPPEEEGRGEAGGRSTWLCML